jgi:hypothetical protein
LTGIVEWVPSVEDLGPITVTVRAANSEGADEHTIHIPVYPAGTDLEPPSAVWYPTVSDITPNGATLSWTPANDNVGVAGYYVIAQRDGRGQGLFPAADTLDPETTVTLSSLAPSTGYRLWVAAYDAARNVAAISGLPPARVTTLALDDTLVMTDTEPPASVTSLTATAILSSEVGLAWDPATDNVGVAGYYIMAQKDGRGQGLLMAAKPITASVPLTPSDLNPDVGDLVEPGPLMAGDTITVSTAYTLSGMHPGTGYQVWVAAYDEAGNVASIADVPPLYVITAVEHGAAVITDTTVITDTPPITGTPASGDTHAPADQPLFLPYIGTPKEQQDESVAE